MIVTLNPLALPDSLPLRRERATPPERRRKAYDQEYDFTTLWYDAFRDGAAGALTMVCPKLLNLEKFLRTADLSTDAGPAAVRKIRKQKFHDVVTVVAPQAASTIYLSHDAWRAEIPVSASCLGQFAGLNCAVTMSRNNRLDWIRDWAHYHVQEHDLQAVLLFDNGSDLYGPEALGEALSQVNGLVTFAVVPTPFKYGPRSKGAFSNTSKFLQSAVLNIARMRFLGEAAGVLSIDVDELVYAERGDRIFEAARRSALGYVPFAGHWLLARRGDGPLRHADHRYNEGSGGTCPFKWCVVPNGLLRGRSWEVHTLLPGAYNRLLRRNNFGYWHCWGINTNWKGYRRDSKKLLGSDNLKAQKRLDAVFGPQVTAV